MMVADIYRSHSGVLFMYINGAWEKQHSLAFQTLMLILNGLSIAETFFLLIKDLKPLRSLDNTLL